MTNQDLFNEFVKNYPDIKVNDYRPLWLDVVKGKHGITIWLDNGDIIFYFPNVNLIDRLFCKPYKAESENKE